MLDGDRTAAAEKFTGVPPDRNFVADMGVSSMMVTRERSLIQAPVTDRVRTLGGHASVGMMATLADVCASDPALAACRPDWTATQDLAVHGAGWLTDGPMVVDCRLIRVGKKVVIVGARVYDAHGVEDFDALAATINDPAAAGAPSLVASALVTFARLPGSAAIGVEDYDPGSWIGQIRDRSTDAEVTGSMYERMGLNVVEASTGAIELARTPYVANSIGTINGGAQAIMIEAAAEAMRPGMVACDLQIHYLSQVKAGPARSSGTVLRDCADHSVVEISLVDAGNTDQLLALATVGLRAP